MSPLLLCALLLGLLTTSSQAEAGSEEWVGWSRTGLSLTPDQLGKTDLRFVEELGADVNLSTDTQLAVQGGLRESGVGKSLDHFDLQRLTLSHSAQAWSITAGRQVRLDARGFERLDGLSATLDDGGGQRLTLWTGRLWSPERWSITPTYVGGFNVELRPTTSTGARSRSTRFDLGVEGRRATTSTARLHLAASHQSPYGYGGLASLEVVPGQHGGARARLNAHYPVGRTHTVAAVLRWEDLPQSAVSQAWRSPTQWLAPSGYAIAGLEWRDVHARWSSHVSLSPTWLAGQGGGLQSRASLSLRPSLYTRLGAFAQSAAVGGSWLAGGGLSASTKQQLVSASADLGVFYLQPLDGLAAPVWEARLNGSSPIYLLPTRGLSLNLGGRLSAGTTRILVPWVRADLLLTTQIDRRTRGGRSQ